MPSNLRIPGEVWDRNRLPIYPGDLVRQFHFKGCGRKNHWLYFKVIEAQNPRHMRLKAHASHETYLLDDDTAATLEVLTTGHYLGEICHHDRKRRPLS